MHARPLTIALFAPYYTHVGTERIMMTLAEGFADRGHIVHLLRAENEWPDADGLGGVELVDIRSDHLIRLLPKRPPYRWWNVLLAAELLPRLTEYLRCYQPDILLTGLMSVIGLAARRRARVETRVIVSMQGLPRPRSLQKRLWNKYYPQADAIVVPAPSMADHMPTSLSQRLACRTIYNPVIDQTMLRKMEGLPEHPWFEGGDPVILAVGRLTRQKDFPTLLKAFARVRGELPARLLILGEGEQREALECMARDLRVEPYVSMPGFVENPYGYMAAADVFVLSSLWEGPGHVYIEAMAAGTPVVVTDCPCGPRDIVAPAEAGLLVPVGDSSAMAEAILRVLRNPQQAGRFAQQGRIAAEAFYPERIVDEYLQLMDERVEEQ